MGKKIVNGIMWGIGGIAVVIGILIACPLGEAIRTISFLVAILIGSLVFYKRCKR